MAPSANSPAKARKTAKAAPIWIGISGQKARPFAIQKGMANIAINPLSPFGIERLRRSQIAAAIMNAARRAIRPSAIELVPIAIPLRIMAYQRVTMRDRAGGATCIPGVRRYAARMTSAPPSATDVLIVGAGIAGAGLAAMLAPHRRVTIIEAEEAPGVHATGRSAAFWHETYGGAGVQPLSTASFERSEEHTSELQSLMRISYAVFCL